MQYPEEDLAQVAVIWARVRLRPSHHNAVMTSLEISDGTRRGCKNAGDKQNNVRSENQLTVDWLDRMKDPVSGTKHR